MKRASLYILIYALMIVGALIFSAWSVLDNTKTFLILEPQQITAAASSSAISLKGYERAHILIAVNASPAATLTAKIYESITAAGTYTYSQEASVTNITTGVLELEVVKNMDAPYIKLELTPTGTMTISAVGVYYEAANAPF